MGNIEWKRIYDPEIEGKGARILVDRLWPRGIKKDNARLTLWAKDIAPSATLRSAYHKGIIDYPTFSAKYAEELNANPKMDEFANQLREYLGEGDVTMLYASREPEKSHVPTLKAYLAERLR